jgi:hypothetical protein
MVIVFYFTFWLLHPLSTPNIIILRSLLINDIFFLNVIFTMCCTKYCMCAYNTFILTYDVQVWIEIIVRCVYESNVCFRT